MIDGWSHALATQTSPQLFQVSLSAVSDRWHRPPSDLSSLPHGIQYLPVELGDDSVIVGVNACPQQSVSLLVQAAQVLVSVPVNMEWGGGARPRGGGA